MIQKKIRTNSKISMIIFAIAGFMLFYTLLDIYVTSNYIAALIKNRQISGFLDVIYVFLRTILPDIFYVVSLAALGYIAGNLKKESSMNILESSMDRYIEGDLDVGENNAPSEDDWDIDELINEFEKK